MAKLVSQSEILVIKLVRSDGMATGQTGMIAHATFGTISLFCVIVRRALVAYFISDYDHS